MKKRYCVTTLLTLVLAALVVPSRAQAAEVYKYARSSTFAIFSSTDGCIYTEVIIGATDGSDKNPSEPRDTFSFVHADIFQYDTCAALTRLAAHGIASLLPTQLKILGNLTSARLRATVNVYDYVSTSSFDVTIDLLWSASGAPVIDEKASYRLREPDCALNTSFTGTVRPAQASGTVARDGRNLTPQPSYTGNILSLTSGTVVLDCPGYG